MATECWLVVGGQLFLVVSLSFVVVLGVVSEVYLMSTSVVHSLGVPTPVTDRCEGHQESESWVSSALQKKHKN